MDSRVKLAMQTLLVLSPFERGQVLCWFCDACHEYVGPGNDHRCKAGSRVYPPAEGYKSEEE